MRPARVDRPDRGAYAVLGVGTIAAGLIVHSTAVIALPATTRDVLADALWATMIYWGLGVLVPATATWIRAAIALGICFAVETSQLLHTPSLDTFRRTTPGHLVLGSGFDPRDFAAYAAGVTAAMLLDRLLVTRGARSRRKA
jgi:hypothetical protein